MESRIIEDRQTTRIPSIDSSLRRSLLRMRLLQFLRNFDGCSSITSYRDVPSTSYWSSNSDGDVLCTRKRSRNGSVGTSGRSRTTFGTPHLWLCSSAQRPAMGVLWVIHVSEVMYELMHVLQISSPSSSWQNSCCTSPSDQKRFTTVPSVPW